MKYLMTFLLFFTTNLMAQKRLVTPEEMEIIKKQQINVVNFDTVVNDANKKANEKTKVSGDTVDLKLNEEKIVNQPTAEKKSQAPKTNKIYKPAPVVDRANQNGYLIERDSPKIVTYKMSHNDTLNIKMCFSAGVSVAFDDSFKETIQRTIIDDLEYFEAKEFENKKGVYIRLKAPIQTGEHWESAIRLVTQSNDKTFLVNLMGVSCPERGANPFPKVYYIQEKAPLLSAATDILTPEDTIIQLSEGLPRKNKNVVRIYDMVASANSNWVIFGIEIQYHNLESEKTNIKMKVLDNYQINTITSKLEPLMLQSQKASEFYGVPTLRFKLAVNIDKNYVLNSRYLYLMILDKESGHYQYKPIDLLPHFMSLKKRGFNI
jgi:hypothetical protein